MIYQDLNSIEGLQFIPLHHDKRPVPKNWQTTKKYYDFTGAQGCGLVCGMLSGNVEALDFDLKYDITGTLMSDYYELVESISPGLLNKLYVQKTMNGGYHLVYRCSEIGGNKKLANRATTQQEKQFTYDKTYHAELEENQQLPQSEREEKAYQAAYIASINDKVRVLIETRGKGGQIACYPMPGYEVVRNSLATIPEITPSERQTLFDVAYMFNEYYDEKPENRPELIAEKKEYSGLTPSDDYNLRGDVIGLLERHGWTYVKRKGSKHLLRRPGDTKAEASGNWDEDLRWFSVFSTSTSFESQKPYKPYAVYAVLECNGDFSQVTKKLAQEGYGDRLQKLETNAIANVPPPSIVSTNDDDFSFLVDDSEMDDYIVKYRNGDFAQGLSTGIPKLDIYFRFKKGNFVGVNGVDNVGKSTVIWYLQFLSSFLHGWKHLVFTSENKAGSLKKKIMEFYIQKPIKQFNDQELIESSNFFKNHFKVIRNPKDMYNYMDILNMAEKVNKVSPLDCLLIDPYNSLKVMSKQSYEYHYEAISRIKAFGEDMGISVYLNAHAGTNAARKVDKKGYIIAPNKADTEMGVMLANKVDEFITIHRLSDHPTEWMFTEIHIRKVKDTETGGKPTPREQPILFTSMNGLVGFWEVQDKSGQAMKLDPVSRQRESKQSVDNFNKHIKHELPEGFDSIGSYDNEPQPF